MMIQCRTESGSNEAKVVRIHGEAYSAGWRVGNLGCVDAAHVATD